MPLPNCAHAMRWRVLQAGNATRDPDRGDRFADRYDFASVDPAAVRRLFGDSAFADDLFRAPLHRWSGPYRSGFGWHLVYVDDRVAARIRPLDEVREQVRADAMAAVRQRRSTEAFDDVARKYTITRSAREAPMRLEILRCPFLLAALLAGHATFAHEIRPAYLEITEQSGHRFDIVWKQPVMGDAAIRLMPHLSNGWLEEAPVEQQATPSSLIRHWTHVADAGESLEGQTITIEGLDRTITDVLVEVTPESGRAIRQIIKPEAPSLTLSFGEPALAVPAYLRSASSTSSPASITCCSCSVLLLLVGSRRRLVLTVTAFTVAHSITLAATTLGIIHIQPAAIEALVALSILYLAVELVRQLAAAET